MLLYEQILIHKLFNFGFVWKNDLQVEYLLVKKMYRPCVAWQADAKLSQSKKNIISTVH